ncbi:MAG: sporulation integral membrane protein YlbJ [Clostridia bacterium]|nr:MAG: sporulation integral membrane protein YlbJ [Clostridia bacterium]
MGKDLRKTGLAAAGLLVVAVMVIWPRDIFQAASTGLAVWLEILVPALFPFFLMSNILMGLGVVHALGVLLEPLMRPVFNLPGPAALVMTIGYSTGAPAAAQFTAQLYREGLCEAGEAARLVAFTTNASPLFILGAVAVGMYASPEIGQTLALSHYLANLILGLLWRFWPNKDTAACSLRTNLGPWQLLRQARTALLRARQSDTRPPGQILGEAINTSFRTLITVGGFVILFAVVIEVLNLLGIIAAISALLAIPLGWLGLDAGLADAISRGLFEMTLGVKAAATSSAPLGDRILATSLILGWAGLSVHAQVAGVLDQTPISSLPFLITRAGHSVLATFLALLLAPLAQPAITIFPRPGGLALPLIAHYLWQQLIWMALAVTLALVASLAIQTASRIRN